MLTPDQDAHRMALYRHGLTDREIAELEGINIRTVGEWRRRRGLPFNPTPHLPYAVPFTEALPPDRWDDMRHYLRLIAVGHSYGYSVAQILEGIATHNGGTMAGRRWVS